MEHHILVVEDSPTQAEHLRLLLEGEGYRVEMARNGREGLDRVRRIRPDLIISDVVMPEMDGYAFCEAVKSDEATRRIPFVLITQKNTALDILMGLERGADNFIPKPFEDHYLLERIARIFEHLEFRARGRLEVDLILRMGKREIQITADKQQIVELLFSTFEELCLLNRQLTETQRTVDEYARNLEAKVEERSRQLLQTEKLATMGLLLAGVAHELNNPLSVVMGQAMLLQMKLGDDPLGDRTRKIQDAAERCARIVRNFLAMARQHPPERQQVYLNKAVEETVELMAYPLRVDTVKVTLDLAPDLPAISGDPHQLQQVLVNLITNAHHAMRATPPPRGLTLTTRFDSARGCVTLEVADTGPGIPAEIRDRIFDPFFTTKPAEEGTGLGLSLCHGIVEGHGGSIGVECPPGQGAVFRVELPVGPPPAPVPGATVPEEVAPLREKRILIVDDEAMIRDLLGDVLRADAHQVDEAASGVGALEKLQAGAYDMILSDIKMPELDGPGLYREVERRQPEMARRFAVLTGDALSPETWAFLEAVPVPRLVKPFTLAEVRRVVRQVLGEKAPDGPGRAGAGRQG